MLAKHLFFGAVDLNGANILELLTSYEGTETNYRKSEGNSLLHEQVGTVMCHKLWLHFI